MKGLLNNVIALDLSNGTASFSSRLLADLGATVVKIEGPEGDPARKASDDGASFLYHNINKQAVLLDLKTPEGRASFLGLINSADVLIDNFEPGTLESIAFGKEEIHSFNPRLIHISVSGSSHPHPECLCRSCYMAALFAANAALINLSKRKLTGKGCHVDLSIWQAARSDRIPGAREDFPIFPCKRGYIQIPILRSWDTLIELLDGEGKTGDLLGAEWRDESYRQSHIGHIIDLVERWTKDHSREELFELGQSMGLPWALIASFRDVVESPQLKARRFFVPVAAQQPPISVPGLPYKFSDFSPPPPRPAPLLGEHNGRLSLDRGTVKGHAKCREEVHPDPSAEDRDVLRGVRVLDLTRMISGPYATRILADFGAEVIKVQSRLTARGAEQNDTPSFAKWNRNKRSITLNLDKPEARALFLELVAVSDIVVENFSPRVMTNWNLDYERLRAVKPDLIMASISAMGRTGPWKNFVGFAPTFHALSGLTFACSQSLDVPQDPGNEYGDVVTGLYATLAILASVEHRSASGKGQHIDLSAYEALCTVAGPALIMAGSAGASGLTGRCYPHILSDQSMLWPGSDPAKDWHPLLGEANRYVFRELLGHSEADYLSLIDRGIIDLECGSLLPHSK